MRTIIFVSAAVGALVMFPSLAQSLMGSSANMADSGVAFELHESALQSGVATSNTTALASAPSRGMSKTQVERDFGAPEIRRAPVGNPPITRWEYQDFIVYFEYSHVIHTVAKQP